MLLNPSVIGALWQDVKAPSKENMRFFKGDSPKLGKAAHTCYAELKEIWANPGSKAEKQTQTQERLSEFTKTNLDNPFALVLKEVFGEKAFKEAEEVKGQEQGRSLRK